MVSKPNPNSTVAVFFIIGCAVVVGGGIANQPMLAVDPALAAKLGGIAAGLIAAALIVERAVEMVLGVPRAATAQTIKNDIATHETEAKIAALENKPTESATSQIAATAAEGDLRMYQEQTKRQAVALSFVLGAVLSLFGARVLAQFWTFPTETVWVADRRRCLLHRRLLSAGGQGVHLLFSTIGSYLNSLKLEGK